jgi:protein SCO1/2
MNRRNFVTSIIPTLVQTAVVTRQAAAGTPAADSGPSARRFPEIMLRTHEDKTVRFYEDLVKGKIVLINFMYATCTNSCPLYTANLARAQRMFGDRMGRDVFMYSITLDPEHDTPAVLRNYVKNYQVQPGWTFLTGSLADITRLRRKLGIKDSDPQVDADKTQHIGVVLYGNERLDRWAACPALAEPTEIVRYVTWIDGTPARGLA